jgi:phosphoribosylaminoimidazolecarboxamide formyltransferase/IMP cyclohydrolase
VSDRQPIRRALVSVYDKTGLPELARALSDAGVELVSTGSTAATIRDAGIAVTDVAEVTGSPEMLDGRVKTLHPSIHGGILADRRLESHRAQLEQFEIAPFDLVIVNLYPFEETVASGAEFQDVIEKIDIGGPAMVRSAAKNFENVAVVVHARDYELAGRAAQQGGFTRDQRMALSAIAFTHVTTYDDAISDWMLSGLFDLDSLEGDELDPATFGERYADTVESVEVDEDEDGDTDASAELLSMSDEDAAELGLVPLRYGENPHQRARLLPTDEQGSLGAAEQLNGKPMSYNNYVDTDAALRAAFDHPEPCVAVVKHNNPCGIAIAGDDQDIAVAHAGAHGTDPVSAYGGVIAANRPVSLAMAKQVKPVFTEVIVAPDFEDEALQLLRKKKNLRILKVAERTAPSVESRNIWGGVLLQEPDSYQAEGDDPSTWTLAAGEAADEATLNDLAFAWRTIRAVKSNAILLAKDGAATGIGMGQVNRVDSCGLAVTRANTLGEHVEGEAAPERARGSVAASDAFFPFADGAQVLIDGGVKAIVQPGGSIRDEEVIEACKAAGVTMYLTGTRHFAH